MIIALIVLLSIIGYAFMIATTAAILDFRFRAEKILVTVGAIYWPLTIIFVIGHLVYSLTWPAMKYVYALFEKWYDFLGRIMVPNK